MKSKKLKNIFFLVIKNIFRKNIKIKRSRFGFFSIPYATHIGDKHYSQNKKSRRTEDKKVITDPRGIFTKPPKKGNITDAFFSDVVKEEKETINRIQMMNEKDREDFLNKVKDRQKSAKSGGEYKPRFKPGGPQDYND